MQDQQTDFKEEMQASGTRIAMLLQVADLPDDQKESWAVLIPEMSLQQLQRMEQYLASRIPKHEVEAAKKFMHDIEEIEKEHQKTVEKINANLEKEISSIEAELDSENK